MSGINKVILIGNLGGEPELTHHGEANTRAVLSVATSDTYTDKSGERVETTEWHRVVVWGNTAEACGQYLKKGSKVCVEGTLQTRRWTDKDGRDRFITEVRARRVIFLDRKPAVGALPIAA